MLAGASENGGYLQFLRFLGFYLQLTRENMQEGSEYVFTPKSFKTVVEYLCKFHVTKDERLVPKVIGKTNFSRCLKRFDL